MSFAREQSGGDCGFSLRGGYISGGNGDRGGASVLGRLGSRSRVPACLRAGVSLVFFMASSSSRLVDVEVRRAPSLSPAKGSEEVSASLSARLGDLILTDIDATGLVIKDVEWEHVP
jgi:hypothetical protein